MNKNIVYAGGAFDWKINCGYIPYRVAKGDRYYRRKFYYNSYWNMCIYIINTHYNKRNGTLVNIYARSEEDNGYHVIASDPAPGDYLLLKDHNHICEIDDIVNSKHSFTGAEIKYWFFIKEIDCFNKQYKGFWGYVDASSDFEIADKTKYFLLGEPDKNGIYHNCRIKKDATFINDILNKRENVKGY